MEAALTNFNKHFHGNRAVFLGDMFELGESALSEHKRIADLAIAAGFDHVILFPEFKKQHPVWTPYFWKIQKKLLNGFLNIPLQNFQILIKGSRSSKMELVMDGLKATA